MITLIVLQKLGIPVFPKTTTNFFKTLVTSTIAYREANNVERPDMIQLLMEASKGAFDYNSEFNRSPNFKFRKEIWYKYGSIRIVLFNAVKSTEA